MIGPGSMGMGGPSGTWTSRKTGQSVIVRDTIIENDKMLVMLSDGRMIPMTEFSREYVQISEEMYDQNGKSLGKQSPQQSLTTQPQHNIDENLLFKGMGEVPKDTFPTETIVEPVQCISNNKEIEMVNKVLNKVHKPKIKFNITWNEFPKDELNMLRKFFDIQNSDITEAIIEKYLDQQSLKAEMQKTIENLLEK